MNDYEMMNQRVDQLRDFLAESHKRSKVEEVYRILIMDELLDTRRQITRADKIAFEILGRQPEVRLLAPVYTIDI